jgi:hypothetical protein
MLLTVVAPMAATAGSTDTNPIGHCICGGRQTFWGQPLGPSPPGVGLLMLRLTGSAFVDLRDPLGRWISYVRADSTYRIDIPQAECNSQPVEGAPGDDDDSAMVADTTSYEELEYETLVRIPGPLDGEYLIRVGHAPHAEWSLWFDAYVANSARYFGDFATSPSQSDAVSTYRLRWDLTNETIVQVDSLASGFLPALRPPRTILRLPCEADPFDSLPAPNARVELSGPGKPILEVALPDGNGYEARPEMISGGHHVGVEYDRYPAFRFEGASRDTYSIAVEAVATGIHVITVSTRTPTGVRMSKSDSLMIRAGEKRYWHTTWFEAGRRDGARVALERGPVPQPAILVAPDTIMAVGSEPALSSDGRWLAFVRESGLWRMEVATGASTRLATLHSPHWPAWSPNGRELLVHADRSDSVHVPAIWRLRSDGIRLRLAIPPSGEPDTYPLWGPRGDRIVWTRGHRLWIADSSGAAAHPLRSRHARVFERASQWIVGDDAILYVANDGAWGGPQYGLRWVRADGSHDHALTSKPRAEDACVIPGTSKLLTNNGRRLFIVEDIPGVEPVIVAPGYQTSGFHRSRVAVARDGKRAYTDGDPGVDGDPVIVAFDVPGTDSHYLMKRWRDGLGLMGADSTTVQAAWGSPHASALHSPNVRVWSYSLRKRGEPEDGWLQFYFLLGRLWSVTRGPEPVRSFQGFP